jgi:hypothetical protein
LAVGICLVWPGLSWADLGLSASLCTYRTFGQTTYEISIPQFDPEAGIEYEFESELEFPLDTFMAGVDLSLSGEFLTNTLWSVNLDLRKNLNDPSSSMTDKDRIGIPAQRVTLTFISTESEAELSAIVVDVNVMLGLIGHPSFTLGGMLGYRYQDFDFEILGVKGWQLDEYLERVYFDEFRGINVLDYDVTYHMPYIGLVGELKAPPKLALSGRIAYSPETRAEDRDDHILRNKLATSDCDGTSMIASIEGIWFLSEPGQGLLWQVVLGGEIVKIDTDGDQDQSWYGDDPVSPEDDTGLRFEGIDNTITSSFQSVSISIGCAF